MQERLARWVCVLCTCALMLLGAGCGGGDSGSRTSATTTRTAPKRTVDPAVQAKLMASGRRVFEQHCHTCHTLLGKKHTGPIIEVEAPNFDDVKPLARYVEQRVHAGGFDMASFDSVLSPARIRAIVTYVSTVAGRNVKESGPSDDVLAQGATVFRDHCQRCHQLLGRPGTGRAPYPGTNLDDVKPSERRVMRQALAGIPEEMPSFRGKLSRTELEAVAKYVTSVAGRGGR